MATRLVEGKKPYTGGKAIEITKDKVINLKLRDENNLIIYDDGDNEIYVDLQLPNEVEPTDAFPVGVNVGRVIVDNGWDKAGTLISAKTTSGDNIKLLYADDGTLWIDNGTGTFKQIYLSTDIATILTDYATKEYVDAHDTIISSTEPEDPYEGMIWYNTGTDKLKVYNGTSWQDIGSGGGGSSYTAGYGIDIDANDEISVDTTEIATQSDLSSKQDELVSGTNIKTINNESLLGSGDITISGGGADIEYKTQAEYDALPSSKLTDGKHYVIYTADTPTPPTPGRPTITGFSYTNKTLSVPQSTYGDANGMVFSADGTKFYMTGEAKNIVYQFSLSTAWDISTASYDNKSKSVVSQTSNVSAGIIFSDDGTTMYIGGGWATGYLFQYTLSTAWDVSTASYDSVQSNISFNETVSYKIYNNGTYVYSLDRTNKTIYRYTMATPRDITSLGSQQSFVLPANGVNNWYHEVVINSQGNQMFVLDRDLKQILIYSLSTAWDITTAILDDTYTIPTPNSLNITSMTIDNGGQNMYLGGGELNNIYQYSTTTA